MNIMTQVGPRTVGGPVHHPRAAPACIKAERDKIEALNRSVERYNHSVQAAAAQGRPLGWFERRINPTTGEVFDWGPRPPMTTLAPLYTMPEWAQVHAVASGPSVTGANT